MKVNLEKYASTIADFGGMTPAQVPGLVEFFAIIEQQAFCDGVRAGRSSSYAPDPETLYETYAAMELQP